MIKYSELFYSLQGEGRFVGVPSVFLRFFGCNMQCPGFGRGGDPSPIDYDKMIAFHDIQNDVAHEDVGKYRFDINEYPIPTVGCDSAMSWSNKFSHLAIEDTVGTIVKMIEDKLPVKTWQHDQRDSINDVHLVLTGGEPLLPKNIHDIMQLLDHLPGLKNLTFETNGTQVIHDDLIMYFNVMTNSKIHVTFSVSPKFSNSGEDYEKAFVPSALLSMNEVKNSFLQLKPVIAKISQFDELQKWLDEYKKRRIFIDAVYVMPEGATAEQQGYYSEIANECLRREFYFSPRLHIDLWGNEWGT